MTISRSGTKWLNYISHQPTADLVYITVSRQPRTDFFYITIIPLHAKQNVSTDIGLTTTLILYNTEKYIWEYGSYAWHLNNERALQWVTYNKLHCENNMIFYVCFGFGDFDPMTSIYELDPYSQEMYRMSGNEIATSTLSKVIIWRHIYRQDQNYIPRHFAGSQKPLSRVKCSMIRESMKWFL